ncbi:AfsR/SARP family transcriptional regulator [Actinosynnema sp. CS-041913]|uniref:AfsR/SARP family transcriptional regulator n=1 Tax=Actinosynnema sp. CS-041913 TaxID=3239917 RepID=UPI003D8B0C61
MDFAVLGPFRMRDASGVDHTPQPRKQRTALALLVVNAGHVVSSGQLREELWPESPPPTSAAAVHVYISRLRKHLQRRGTVRVQTRPHGYLVESVDRLDLDRFRAWTREARDAQVAGDLESASTLLRRAVDLWDGAALADVREGVALHHLAIRLDEEHLAAQEQLVRVNLMLNRHKELVGELHILVDRYPQWETFHGYLMIALYRAGRTAEALTAYSRLRERLVAGLGMEPGPEIQRLHRLMLRRDRELETSASVHRL